ncbi:hypothetical protein DdX_16822 [Ditylenchus destructor]|uniref:Uncharacterized protein n=1 Tax=Ditylenchus destructor TaxID=166010 RepID=A0AAD4QZJ6_9BILA|nr:hypothetical protein DdX_16822 [Ditylenchus destructor]
MECYSIYFSITFCVTILNGVSLADIFSDIRPIGILGDIRPIGLLMRLKYITPDLDDTEDSRYDLPDNFQKMASELDQKILIHMSGFDQDIRGNSTTLTAETTEDNMKQLYEKDMHTPVSYINATLPRPVAKIDMPSFVATAVVLLMVVVLTLLALWIFLLTLNAAGLLCSFDNNNNNCILRTPRPSYADFSDEINRF